MNELFNDKAVYRTAPATPGLLNIWPNNYIADPGEVRGCSTNTVFPNFTEN